MSAVKALPALPLQDSPRPGLTERQSALLNRLRFHAVTCRAKARLEFFAACAVIDPKAQKTQGERITLLLRLLGQVLPGGAVFHRPGAAEISFDERWLLSVIAASDRNDHDSLEFLVRRRVEPSKRRLFALLVSGLGDGALPV